jgi:hypothetical protein
MERGLGDPEGNVSATEGDGEGVRFATGDGERFLST